MPSPTGRQYDSLASVLNGLRSSPRDRQGRLLSSQEYSFKSIVAAVGELASASANNVGNAADHEHLSKAIGALICSTVAFSENYRVDIGAAVAAYLSESGDGGRKNLRVEPTGGAGNADDVLLSPRTASNFFPELDRYRSKTRDDYNNELSWFVVLDNGEIFDLKPNGRNIPVAYDDLQYYLTLADMHRRQPTAAVVNDNRVNNPPVVESNSTPVQRVTKTLQVNAPGYNPAQEAALFSPTHFDNGLFAPLNNNTSVQVTYGGNDPSPPARNAPPRMSSAPATATVGGTATGSAETDRFWSIIAKIESGEIRREDVASYGLSYSVPAADGQTIELVSGGSKITVNRNNVDSFLTSVRERMSSRDSARAIRTGSIRPMVVTNVPYNPVVDEGKFSPSHFTGNLFAPFNSNTAVNVDLNNENLVPSVLRGGSNQVVVAPPPQLPQQQLNGYRDASAAWMGNQQNGVGANNAPSGSGAGALAAMRNFNARKNQQPSYVDRIRQSDDEFVAILSNLDADHERATEFGVTFCIPSACVNKAVLASRPTANADGIFDLVPNGRNIPVTSANVPEYFQLIEGAAKV